MIFGKRPGDTRLRSEISGPDIPAEVYIHQKGKDPKYFPVAKYICVVKTVDDKRKFKVHGYLRSTKLYGVGVLTDKNNYYFSTICVKHQELTCFNRRLFQSAITSKYILTPETRVTVSDNIGDKDPIYAFLKIVGSAVGFLIKTKGHYKMLRALNIKFKYVKTARKKDYATMKWHSKQVLRRLIENDRFDFITDPDWQDQLSTRSKRIQKAFYECAVAILFLFQCDIALLYRSHTRERKLKEKLELAREEAKKERAE